MTYVKKVFKSVAYLFLALLVSLCIYTFVMTDILKKDYANVFGYTYFVVATGSMSGTIEVNDIVIVKIGTDAKLNDVITYQDKDGQFITHRVVKKIGSKIITQGDVNNAEDEAITSKDVVGKVRLVVSPSFLLKAIATFLILFILLALINFDKIFKKYVVKDSKKITEDLFKDKSKEIYVPSGNTVTIPIEEIFNIQLEEENKEKKEEEIEVLDEEEIIDLDDNNIILKQNTTASKKEKELLEQVVNLLRIKNSALATTKINKKWLTKYQYIYKLTNIVSCGDNVELVESINHPTFKEIFDYDLDKAGLYENLRNKIYDMPIYIFLRILAFAVLYNDEAFFDGVYKILKYKVQIDKDNYFKTVTGSYGKKQVKSLIVFMQRIPNKFDNKNVFELEKIERYVKLKKYVNN